MDATASGFFGKQVEAYDSLIRRCVPRYDEMLERLVAYLPERAERLLELGCGTGNLTLPLAARYPDAHLHLVDGSPEMLEVARQRLGERAHLRTEPVFFEDLELEPASLDLVTSAISLHHVRDKADLYRRLFAALEPGGAFVFADQLRGRTDAEHDVNWAAWLEFCRLPGHCSEAEVTDLLDHAAAHDHYTPLEEHLELLRAAGFRDLDCTWRNWIWGVVVARKP